MTNTLRSAQATVGAPIRCQSISFVLDLPAGTYPVTVEMMHVRLPDQTINQIGRVLIGVTRAEIEAGGGTTSPSFDSASVDIAPEIARGEATLSDLV